MRSGAVLEITYTAKGEKTSTLPHLERPCRVCFHRDFLRSKEGTEGLTLPVRALCPV